MKPLEEPPQVEEGDDSVNTPDDVEVVTMVDFEDTEDLRDEDTYEPDE